MTARVVDNIGVGRVLTDKEIEQFIEDGYVVVREAFPSSVAAEVREKLWAELGLSPDDRSQWTKNVVSLQKVFHGPPFSGAFTPRLTSALDELMGAGRYHPPTGLGWWPVAFPGFEPPPWKPPTTGWHIDGIQFHHHVDSADQGMLPIFLLSDIAPGGGGTAVSVGSHKVGARILAAAEPDGLHVNELAKRAIAADPRDRVVELTGRAGDVALHHPFMLHARSPNTGNAVRFICNPCITLKEKMNLARPNAADYSPVEQAIVRALGAPVH